jgi:hypothetical protein
VYCVLDKFVVLVILVWLSEWFKKLLDFLFFKFFAMRGNSWSLYLFEISQGGNTLKNFHVRNIVRCLVQEQENINAKEELHFIMYK